MRVCVAVTSRVEARKAATASLSLEGCFCITCYAFVSLELTNVSNLYGICQQSSPIISTAAI